MMNLSEKFACLGKPQRVWAVAAIHGDLKRLATLHDHIATRFAVGDRIVYLGNYLGVGSYDNQAVIEELLTFRSALLAKPGMEPGDIVHLRGPAEEAWQRLLRLQFAPAPSQTLECLFKCGIEPYLRLYGISLHETKSMARADSVTITRWTNHLRFVQRKTPGHEPLVCSMKRAAVTAHKASEGGAILFVPSGFDITRTLEDQGDSLWYCISAFNVSTGKKTPYARIVRGYDPERGGIVTEGLGVTIDGGCGFGGPLACACFNAEGHLLEIVTIGGLSAYEPVLQKPCIEDGDVDTNRERSSTSERRIALSA